MFGNMFGDVQASTSLNLGENMRIESTTTDDTTANALAIPVPEDQAVQVDAHITARLSDGSKRAMWHLSGLFYRNAGGSVAAEGEVLSLDTRISAGCGYTAVLYPDTVTNQVQVRVTGTAEETVYWLAQASYFRK